MGVSVAAPPFATGRPRASSEHPCSPPGWSPRVLGMSMGAGGATARADAFALACVLVAVTGCSTDGGAGVALGGAGAAFARTTAGTGSGSTTFVVETLSALTAALAVAMNALFVNVLRTFEAAVRAGAVVSMSFSNNVLASPPARAWARAAPSALERSTLAIWSIAVGAAGVTGSTTRVFLRIDVILLWCTG